VFELDLPPAVLAYPVCRHTESEQALAAFTDARTAFERSKPDLAHSSWI
jgi:hypothetical protein